MSQKVAGLKKEFQEKDVERLRNLITGKYGKKTGSSVGFSKAEEFYAEGDIWESDGRTWTIKNGIKQNITKLDKAKKAHVMPLLCPCCKKIMKKRIDKPSYNLHKKCFNCVVEMEHKMRIEGTWEKYIYNLHNQQIDHNLEEFKNFVKEKLKESNNSFVSEDGDVEKWVGKLDEDKVNEYLASVEEYAKALKK
jgi:hypothetical protein|tara:strand:+ start:1144 stop:1722 length:579 start_codon:yes stop_codon:yes gene_type:complete